VWSSAVSFWKTSLLIQRLFIWLKGTFDFLLILSDISKHQDINSKCPQCHGYMESVEGQKKFEKLTGGSEKQAWTANHKERLSVIITMEDNAKVVAAVVWLFVWRTTNFLISVWDGLWMTAMKWEGDGGRMSFSCFFFFLKYAPSFLKTATALAEKQYSLFKRLI